MRRLIAPCACALALITGAWFGQAYILFTELDPVAVADPSAERAVDTVWRFYDAIDSFFRTGDDRALRAVVAPEFADHIIQPTSPADREGLIGYLASLRDTFPSLRLVPQDVIVQEGRVVTRLSVDGATVGSVLGIPLTGTAPWPRVDIVRVYRDQIVERWGEPAGYATATPLFAETMAIPYLGDVVPVLQRLTYAPGATELKVDQRGPAIISVESGNLDVSVGGERAGAYQPADVGGSGGHPPKVWATTTTIGPGGVVVVPDRVAFAMSNLSESPAVALRFNLIQPTRGVVRTHEASADASAAGVKVQTLAGYSVALVGAGDFTVDLIRVSLAPGARLGSHPIPVLELVAVESGTLTAVLDGHPVTAWLRDARGRSITPDLLSTIDEGFGLTIGKGASTSYHNESTQPVSVLLLKLAST